MKAEALIVKAGIATTLQDLGRVGYLACGVPRSGALDSLSLRLANLVVGNSVDTAALEMLYSGALIEARAAAFRFALAGANAIIESTSGEALRAVPPWQSAVLHRGERLRVATIVDASAAYLAIEGGFEIEPVLGSFSTYVRGRLGGWHGRALRAGDALPLREPAVKRAERRLPHAPKIVSPKILRVQPGPHLDRFAADALECFLNSDYKVTSSSDRTGLRLEGRKLRHASDYDLMSEGVVPGSIQVPGSGQPVLLIADHPTVGGYPRIATVISADIPAAGRLRIGGTVRFTAVNDTDANRARLDAVESFARMAASVERVS